MTDLQKIMDTPITPLPQATLEAVSAAVYRQCTPDVADLVADALGLR